VAADVDYRVVTEPMSQDIGGYCNPSECLIGLNDESTINQRAKTLVHELSRMLVHSGDSEDGETFSYAEEELIVEAVAFTVTESMGLGTSDYSIPYLASWSQ
jgi:hypothetical protein